ncbi:acetylcholine receptor subunit alpha-type acr-16-like [Babylonia areolata]|uniref:acetylcholine receptor subunit alpha-type acr-16-like n=1 Tax=Babylonia areolata TaxID=304850 RepID=UPI003FD2A22A
MSFFSFQEKIKSSEAHLIRETLLKSYDPLVSPTLNSSQKVYLNVSIGLKSVIQLDMKKQTLISSGWLRITWYDEFLHWDPQQFPHREVHLKADMVWCPDLVVYNTLSDLDQMARLKRKVIVHHTGLVTWYPGGLFQTYCSVDIFHYPLDTQTCSIEVTPWSTTNDYLNGTWGDPAFEISGGIENHPEWKLTDRKTRYQLWPDSFWRIYFIYTLERKVTFYVLNMILPVSLLSLLNCMVFVLPVECGEKMTVSVTVFLSFTVFLSLINNSLPQNSDSVCLFSVYVTVQMFMSVCFIVMGACIVFIYGQDKDCCFASQRHFRSSESSERKMSFGIVSYDRKKCRLV